MCMSMEAPGTEAVKRQRLDSYGSSVRFPPLGQDGFGQHEYPVSGSLQSPSTYNHTPLSVAPYATNPPPQQASLPLRDQHQIYEQKNGSFGAANQERLPPVDTNPLHGVGHPPVSLSPGERTTPALRPIETSYSEAQSYMQHPPLHGTPPAYAHQGPPPLHPPSTPNGSVYHTHPLPMAPSSYDQSQPHSSGPSYSDIHGPPFSAGPYGAHGPSPWRNHYPPQPPSIPSKKGSRATQACETCRQRKAKCDEGKPTCSYCKETKVTCVYKEMQPAKADRAQREIMDALKKTDDICMDALKRTDDNYLNMRDDFSRLSDKVDKVESYLKSLNTIAAFIDGLRAPENKALVERLVEAELNASLLDSTDTNSTSHTHEEVALQRVHSTENPEMMHRNPVLTAGHTVMAHRLLHWRSIKELLAGKSLEDDYVMAFEERKGILRLYGKGQGKDSYDGAVSGTASSPASSASDEMGPRSPHDLASQDSCWGDLSLGLPNIVDGKFFQNEKHHLGGLTRDGDLQLDKNAMYSLMESYLSNIHILHPILDRIRLRRMVEKVWRDYNPVEATANKSPFLPNAPYQRGGHTMKRKYSIGGTSPEDKKGATITNGVHSSTSSQLPRRTSTVIVLLVMALGKICQYKDPLPGFAPVFEGSSSSTVQTMSPITNSSSPLIPSELRGITGLRAGQGFATFNAKGMRKGDRNVDVVPGLAYFATATSILGTLQGNDLAFAQAYLLAALYTAQLACVLESWTWITNACRVCCFLVRDPSFSREKDMKRVDLTRFVYLASLQLESDILAEFDLQPSVLQDIDPDGKIGVPYGVVEDAIDIEFTSQPDDILLYYTYQLSLRKCMNDWQRHLYPPSRGDNEINVDIKGKGNYSIDDRNHCEQTLTKLRDMMQKHPELSWEETEEPSNYINAARLRGKYYGAKYFIHRPFLRYALHTFTEANLNPRVMERYLEFAKDPSSHKLEKMAPTDLSKDDLNDWWSLQFLISCHLCVEAAKKSTTAFDGVLKEQRLMITNLFGTAHAQFGNMLVLSAVYSSRVLDFLVDERELKHLLERTIQFLHSLAPISTTLAKDCELLMVIREKIERGFKISKNVNNFTAFESNLRFV